MHCLRSPLLALGLLLLLLLGACGDGDIRKGCKNYCKCHRGKKSATTCRDRCEERLSALKKRDRALGRQVAECLARKGKRKCDELARCAGPYLNKK
jgi:hypothetical protein